MRVLFATGSPRSYMAPPRLAPEQIVCGPDWKTETIGGRVASLTTPVGMYDLASVANRLPQEQRPDVVVCLVDASRRNLPTNLRAFRCPRVLLLADTHHMDEPLTQLINYALTEPYDRIVILYDRHHADLLRMAGVKNLFWFPGLTFPHADAVVKAGRQRSRSNTVAFVGQRGRHHPRRSRLLDAMEQAQLPLDVRVVPQEEALRVYGRSSIGFNASLNGDLNLRVLEILGTGGMLLTDRLAPSSGLLELWQEGRELVTYGSPEELVERAQYYVSHPEAARSIAGTGQTWFDEHFSAASRERAFAALAHDGICPAEFSMPAPALAVAPSSGWPRLAPTFGIFEFIQELHRQQESVKIVLGGGPMPELTAACATLPRIRILTLTEAEATEIDVLVVRDGIPTGTVLDRTRHVVVLDGRERLTPQLLGVLSGAGLRPIHQKWLIFGRQSDAGVTQPARQAELLMEAGDYAAAMQIAQATLKQDPSSIDALSVMIELALEMGNRELAGRLLAAARRVAPTDERTATLLQEMNQPMRVRKLPARLLATARKALAERDWTRAVAAARAALTTDRQAVGAHAILGRALAAGGAFKEAIASLEQANREDPADRDVAEALATARHASEAAMVGIAQS